MLTTQVIPSVLIVFHGALPTANRPAPGIAIRAWSLGQGLTAHGVTVHFASRTRDLVAEPDAAGPIVHPFESPQELQALARQLNPTLILAVGADTMSWLRPLQMPIALDLFAPRLLEMQWETDDPAQETLAWLDAIARADYFVVTTARARYLLLGQLPLAGVDCREDRLLTIPLSLELSEDALKLKARPRAPEPLLVAGGVAWPWQDPRWALTQTLASLRAHPEARLKLLRGPYPLHSEQASIPPVPLPPDPQVDVTGMLPYSDMLSLFHEAWAAVDLMAPNLEREVALSFRQLDALRCGLPLIIGSHAPLAPLIADFDAGWVLQHGDQTALQQCLAEVLTGGRALDRKSRNVWKLAQKHFQSKDAVRPLLEVLAAPTRRAGREPLSAQLSRLATDARDQQLQFRMQVHKIGELEAVILKKDEDITSLRHQLSTLTDALGRVSLSLEEQVFIRRDAQAEYSTLSHQQRITQLDSEREIATLKRELQKKTELTIELMTQREALEQSIERLHEAEGANRLRADKAVEALAVLEGRRQSEQSLQQELVIQRDSLSLSLEKKQQEIESLRQQREALQSSIQNLQTELEAQALRLVTEQTRARNALEETSLAFKHTLEQVQKESEARRQIERQNQQEELDNLRFWHQQEKSALIGERERLSDGNRELTQLLFITENTILSKDESIKCLERSVEEKQAEIARLMEFSPEIVQRLRDEIHALMLANQKQHQEHGVETRMLREEVDAFRTHVQLLEQERQRLRLELEEQGAQLALLSQPRPLKQELRERLESGALGHTVKTMLGKWKSDGH